LPITSYSLAKVYYSSQLSLAGETRWSAKPWYLLLPRQAARTVYSRAVVQHCCSQLADILVVCVASSVLHWSLTHRDATALPPQ